MLPTHRHTLLFKGSEDLRLDERIMQLLRVSNQLLSRQSPQARQLGVAVQTGAQGLHARHYGVVPLGPRSGLIEWVNGAVSLFSLYKVACVCVEL